MKKYVHIEEVSVFEFDGTWESVQSNMPEHLQKQCEIDIYGNLILPEYDNGGSCAVAEKGEFCVECSDGTWLSAKKEEFLKLFSEKKENTEDAPLHKGQTSNNREMFIKACKPLMDYLRDNYHPHCSAIVTCTHCEILAGMEAYSDPNNIND